MKNSLAVAVLLSALVGLPARGDEVIVKGREKPVVGDLRNEDAKGVVINALLDKKKVDQVFPAIDVLDVHYDDIKPVTLNLSGGAYRVAKDAEKDASDPAKRKIAIGIAIKNYADTLTKMLPHANGKRTIEYRIAMLMVNQAKLDQGSTDKALAKLQAFKSAHPTCWHLVHVMPTIAEIQLAAKDYKGAEATFQEMSEMEALSANARLSAELEIVQVNLLSGNVAKAEKKLDDLTKHGQEPRDALPSQHGTRRGPRQPKERRRSRQIAQDNCKRQQRQTHQSHGSQRTW